jgi:hypothetical protein
MTDVVDTSIWHNDGHSITLELNRSNILVTEVICPKTEECTHDVYGCIVEWFVTRFGLECNVGVAPAQPKMEIAWMLAGDTYDLEAAQVWIIPTSDDAFSAWLITQQ